MDYSYNDILRNNICKENIEDSIVYFESLPYDSKEKLIDIMLLDHYKLEYIANKNYPELFEHSKEEIYKKCIYDTNVLVELLKSTYVFNDTSFFNKFILLQEMQYYNQDINLMKISKMHLLDKITYQIKDELDSYKDYYVDFKSKTPIELVDPFVCLITMRLYDMKNLDFDKYKKSVLEIIKVYYKWKNFIKNHEGKYLLNDEDKKYIDILEKFEFDKLLILLENNNHFFSYILGEYLHYTTANIEIKEDIVDDYLSKTSSKILKKKFDIK